MSGFESLLGTTPGVFISVTLILMGGCAFIEGQSLAATWRPMWMAIPYTLLLGLGDRFVTYALFQGELFLPTGYIIDTAWLIGVALFAYRVTQARQMPVQYPWLYERAGLLNWREKR
jgi:branched-chain amino acid transport system ATP-binding protein